MAERSASPNSSAFFSAEFPGTSSSSSRVCGRRRQHAAQRLVGADHVGRQLALGGDLAAHLAQALEQLRVITQAPGRTARLGPQHVHRATRPLGGTARARAALQREGERRGRVLRQHLDGALAQPEHRVLPLALRQVPAPHELAEHVP